MSIYKANDIRGRYPDELNEALYERLGSSVARLCQPGEVLLVGGDVRISTPALKEALISGLLRSGIHVQDLGIGPTPVHYYALRTRPNAAGLLIVTASHNPPADNGLKLMLHGEPPTPEQIKQIEVGAEELPPPAAASGHLTSLDVKEEYCRWICKRFQAHSDRPYQIAVDAGNGCWSELAPDVFKQCGFEVDPLYCEIDGRYPSRAPDSANPANLKALQKKVSETRGQLGVAFDGDGDRVAFVAEGGRLVTADEAAFILADLVLSGTREEAIVYDLKLSRIIQQAAARHGARSLAERSGHAYIKTRMLAENAVFGCEASGHFFYRELRGGDDGLFTALLLACSLAERGDTLGMRLACLPPHVITPDIRLSCESAAARHLIETIAARYPAERLLRLDGVRVEYPNGWALARVSITEPKITFRFESDTQEGLRAIAGEFLSGHPQMFLQVLDRLPDDPPNPP